MKITKENKGQEVVLKVLVEEGDYKTAVEKALKDYRKKANIPGFRPGMVPAGMIKKMYGKGVLAEEAYRLASQGAFDYIEKEKIEIIGDVLPSEKQGDLDFDKEGAAFEFVFEIGLAPEVKIELTDKDKLTKYTIEPDKEMLANYRSSFLRRFGKLEDAEKVTSDEALGVTLDNEEINIEDAYVGLISMDDKARKPFIGKKVGDTLDVDINKLYPTPSQRAAILKMKEEELEAINPKFRLSITSIRKFVEPAVDDELLKQAFPDGSVKTAKEFDDFIDDQIARDLSRETDAVFKIQVRKMLSEKAALKMPEDFLKRWLFNINEGKFPMEQIEAEFPQFLDMMRWNLVQKHYAKDFEVKVTPEDALAEAKNYAAMQFAQYGMPNVGDEMLENYAKQIMTNKDEARKVYDVVYEQKILDAIMPTLKVTEKTVSPAEFNKLAEKL